jgi:hypothetical protein
MGGKEEATINQHGLGNTSMTAGIDDSVGGGGGGGGDGDDDDDDDDDDDHFQLAPKQIIREILAFGWRFHRYTGST